jgi:hypothetical protein
MFGKLLDLFKKKKPLDEMLDDFLKSNNLDKNDILIQQNYKWNSFLGINVNFLIEKDNKVYLFVKDINDAESLKLNLNSNMEYVGKDIFLYTVNDGDFIEFGSRIGKKSIEKKEKKDKEDYTKLFQFITGNNSNLLDIVEKYYSENKKNNPIRKAEDELTKYLIEYLSQNFENAKLLYKGMQKKDETRLINTKEDLIIFNTLSGRENFKEGVNHFSLVIGRAVYEENLKSHQIKSGIVFNLTNGEMYYANPYGNTKFFNGTDIIDFYPKQTSFFMDTTPIKIFMKDKGINEDYRKENSQFFKYLNKISQGNYNKTIVDELSLALNMVEDSTTFPIIIAPQFPVWNAPVAYLLERMGYDAIINYHCMIDTKNLTTRPLIYTHSSIQEDFQTKMFR